MFFEQLPIQNWGFLLQKDIKTNGKTSSLQISAVPQRIDTSSLLAQLNHSLHVLVEAQLPIGIVHCELSKVHSHERIKARFWFDMVKIC